LEVSAINLDHLYASLKGVIRPPFERISIPSQVVREPLVLAGVRECCYWMARAFGWEFKGEIPEDIDRAVVIIAPHTSQIDFFIGMAAYRHFKEFRGYYLAKKELFRGPFKWIFEQTGGIPVDRSKNNNLVGQVADFINSMDRKMFLALAPEGTRSYTQKWKSGFYRIAVEAGVPILMAYLDFDKREGGIGDVLYPTGDYESDARKIEAFYKDKTAFWQKKWNWKVT
jgi:1-acyl-sn-glycerol-3-phosphate acyltransferase